MIPAEQAERAGELREDATNQFGQRVGYPVVDWQPPPWPTDQPLVGRYAVLERLTPERHGAELFAELGGLETESRWTYLPYGPFTDRAVFGRWLEEQARGSDPWFYAILAGDSGRALGLASFLRVTPAVGVIEVGHLVFSRALSRTRVATEAMFLMMDWAFRSGYRRYEWKCDALNGPSRQAAERLGFTFEGIFRQATIYRGRNRDTAWYAIVDGDWPAIRANFERWLSPDNFDGKGRQRTPLRERSTRGY